jgi:L-seryl-tRNA(Ser) seleniumtransferase
VANLRNLPSVDRLLSHPDLQGLGSPSYVRDVIRLVLDDIRREMRDDFPDEPLEFYVERVQLRAAEDERMRLGYAINATGVVLHTGLGRARLCESAQKAVQEATRGHSTLEIDRDTGKRGSRQSQFKELLTRLTGAEDAYVCNNNAAAVMLCVNTLAAGREAILSRGQCVEIGGSFRMPDVIAAAGARMREVGTTNKTRLSDYEKAIVPETGCIIRCHPSNFQVVGFTEDVDPAALAKLGRERGVAVIDDIGSGCLVDTALAGLPHEPTLTEALATGVDLVTASGDKLLGGPQAGLALGRKELIERVAKNPMARAVRCDKLTLAALEATLREYLDPDQVWSRIPTLIYLRRSLDELDRMARELMAQIEASCKESKPLGLAVDVVDGLSEVGGGSLPGSVLPTRLLRVRSHASPEDDAHALRLRTPPVFARIVDDHVCFDPRTIDVEEIPVVVGAIHDSLTTLGRPV